jgi:drug/metabolite transporter (DMT)-like permease
VALVLACLSSLCFGVALVTSKFGLRSLDARAGAAISIPTATLLFILAAPFTVDLSGFVLSAVAIFTAVGVFFPALVTLLTFLSTDRLGPTVTGAISGTAPLFALAAAALILGETISGKALSAAAGVAVGIALLSWKGRTVGPGMSARDLLIPLSGALVRGTAQALARAGLLLWPSPFAASLIAYIVSSGTVLTANRLGGARKAQSDRRARYWFMLTGVLNGAAVLLMYMALASAPVSVVAPVVASYPLVTILVSALALHDEDLGWRRIAGALVLVGSIAYLVAG